MATVEELRERAKELDIEGRSSMNKDELEKAVANAEGSSNSDAGQQEQARAESEVEAQNEGAATKKDVEAEASATHHSEASDLDNPEVVSDLSPAGQEAASQMGDVAKEEADAALDASGPLHLQSPEHRVMTGAVNEAHAKEQAEIAKDVPEDYVGDLTEAGLPDGYGRKVGAPKDNLSENDERDPEDVYEVRQEHVIDFPAPVGQREGDEQVDSSATEEQAPSGAFHNEPLGSASQAGARSRLFEQKAVFYTDGLSGEADMNLERAHALPEVLQSNDPEVRAAGDVSESEAAKEQKEENLSDREQRQAERVKSGEVQEDSQ